MSLLKVALAFSLLSLSNAKTNLSLKVKDPAGVLSIPLKRVDRPVEAATSVQRRYFRTGLLDIIGAAYLAELTIGTGSTDQVVEVLLDTGSFELWVNPNCTSSNVPYYCNQFGHYDPTLSPTAHTLNETFQITYGSGSTSGVYYTDDIFISGAGLDNQQFGVAITSDQVWFGIMGLSRGLGNGFIDYNTIVDTLLAQSFTNSRLFSLDLGSQGPPQVAITGEIVFGGVDKNKYSGNLAKVPTDPSDAHYTVILTSLAHKPPTAQTSTTITNTPISLIVDSGTTLSLLPENVVDALAGQFPGALSDGQGGYKVPCAYQSQPGTVDFSFGNVRISVPYSEFIWNSGTTENCFLGAWNNPAVDVYILGDTFLRGAYVVFDQDSRALYMGNYINCGDSSLAPVPAGVDAAAAIPGNCAAVLPPIASSNTATATGTLPSLGASVNPAGPVSVSSSAISTATPSFVSGVSTVNPSESQFISMSGTVTFTSASSSTGPSTGLTSLSTSGSATSIVAGSSTDPSAGPVSLSIASSVTFIPGGSPTGLLTSISTAGGYPNLISTDPTLSQVRATSTSTVTNLIPYTVTACSPEVIDCTLGQVATSTSLSVTTICPEDDLPANTALPQAPVPPGAVTAFGTYTRTVTSTVTYTITTCSPEGTDGPLDQVGTSTSVHVTTVCPEDGLPPSTATPQAPIPPGAALAFGTITSTVTNLVTYTITACPPEVTNCPLGQVTTSTDVYVSKHLKDYLPPNMTITRTPMPPTATPVIQDGDGFGRDQSAPDQGTEMVGVAGTVSEHYETSTFAIQSCAAGALSCTIGATTTEVQTFYWNLSAAKQVPPTPSPDDNTDLSAAVHTGNGGGSLAAAPGKSAMGMPVYAGAAGLQVNAWSIMIWLSSVVIVLFF